MRLFQPLPVRTAARKFETPRQFNATVPHTVSIANAPHLDGSNAIAPSANNLNIFVLGPTGVGRWLLSALGTFAKSEVDQARAKVSETCTDPPHAAEPKWNGCVGLLYTLGDYEKALSRSNRNVEFWDNESRNLQAFRRQGNRILISMANSETQAGHLCKLGRYDEAVSDFNEFSAVVKISGWRPEYKHERLGILVRETVNRPNTTRQIGSGDLGNSALTAKQEIEQTELSGRSLPLPTSSHAVRTDRWLAAY